MPGMTAHRLPDGQARIVLDWPEDVPHLVVGWTPVDAAGGGGTHRHRARLPARRAAPARRTRRRPGAGRLGAPGCPARWSWCPARPKCCCRRTRPSPTTWCGRPGGCSAGAARCCGCALTAPGGLPEVPEFVCVARGGTLRPRNATDGTTVLRIPGPELARHGSLERELPAAPLPGPPTPCAASCSGSTPPRSASKNPLSPAWWCAEP
ncbi:hypothetical protein LT493_39575 [Streptomyces tricolor]|nr:hypothetical protein [Streptomyces tricolor]